MRNGEEKKTALRIALGMGGQGRVWARVGLGRGLWVCTLE